MKPLKSWMAQYAESHRHPANKLIHRICVPAIFFSIVGLLSLIRMPGRDSIFLSVAPIAGLATLVFYFRLGFVPALKMLSLYVVGFLFFAWVEPKLSAPAAWYALVFVVAWIGQFVGHEIEGKKPSFFEDLQFLLIGPLWVFRMGKS